MRTKKFTAYTTLSVAVACAGGAGLCFGYFLIAGPVVAQRVLLSNAGRLSWDVLLSLLFFSTHSLLIRQTVRSQVTRFVAEQYYPAFFAIVSSLILFLVVFLWQPSEDTGIRFTEGVAWLLRFISFGMMLGFVFTVKSLRAFNRFDLIGRRVVLDHLSGRRARPTRLFICGPYRYVRHPLYALTIGLFWSTSSMTIDRLLLNVLWTAWIVIGTYLEERDLVMEFGAKYCEYQRMVPRLIPWRRAKIRLDGA